MDLKFRMWDEQYKYMNYKVMIGMWGSEEVMDDENYTACMAYVPHDWYHFEPYEKNIKIMQYVGHKDKNGKDIYEGDIVRSDWGYGETPKVVELDTFLYASLECTISDDIEVIGNIYENSELVKFLNIK